MTGEKKEATVMASEQIVSYVLRYGGNCRDCADADGICPNTDMPCSFELKTAVIKHTLTALSYGISHGFIADPFTRPAPTDLKARDRKHYKLIRKSLQNKGLLPADTNTELVTKGFLYQTLTEKNGWVSVYSLTDPAEGGLPYRSIEAVVTRSRAVELLAAKDDECKSIEATLNAWFDTKKITEDSLKPLMVAAVKGYLRTCLSGGMPQELIDEVLPAVECMIDYGVFTESVTQYTMSLKADNAAKDARINFLERAWKKAESRAEALEAKLAAAQKVREAAIELDEAISDDFNIFGAQQKLRAVLGGKSS